MYTSNQRKPRTVVIIYWAKNNEVEEERENTVGILEWRSLRRRESATGCKDGFSCWGELDANSTDSSNITPTTTPISLSLSLSLSVCVCVLVLLQRKRKEQTKGKGNAKEWINRRFLFSGSFLKFKVETFAALHIQTNKRVSIACPLYIFRALALENANNTLFYRSINSFYHYTILFYNISTFQNSISIKILFFNISLLFLYKIGRASCRERV